MRAWADSTLMSMKKSDLIECLRCAEHNQAVAEEQLAQHIENVKDWVPVVRCKDCRWRGREECAMFYRCECGEQHTWETDNDFCSYGERKEQVQ